MIQAALENFVGINYSDVRSVRNMTKKFGEMGEKMKEIARKMRWRCHFKGNE